MQWILLNTNKGNKKSNLDGHSQKSLRQKNIPHLKKVIDDELYAMRDYKDLPKAPPP
jgi:hypothetical protein